MTGQQFLDAFNAAILPRTIINMRGVSDKIVLTLSDSTIIEAKRAAVKAASNQAELDAYVAGLLA